MTSVHDEATAFAREYMNAVTKALNAVPTAAIADIIDVLWQAYEADRQIFFIGNGGIAAKAYTPRAPTASATTSASAWPPRFSDERAGAARRDDRDVRSRRAALRRALVRRSNAQSGPREAGASHRRARVARAFSHPRRGVR